MNNELLDEDFDEAEMEAMERYWRAYFGVSEKRYAYKPDQDERYRAEMQDAGRGHLLR